MSQDTIKQMPHSDRPVPARWQRTLGGVISCAGIGLHSGVHTTMTLHPAGADVGIRFLRTDQGEDDAWIDARLACVSSTQRGTMLRNANGVTLMTVEHVLAALAGMGVDNARIEIDNEEVPAMDGSAVPFIAMIEKAGVVRQDVPRRYIHITAPVRVQRQNAWAQFEPADHTALDVSIVYDDAVVGRQNIQLALGPAAFKKKIAPARTYAFAHEIEALRRQGLAKGGAEDNCIIIEKDGIRNAGGLRLKDECVRHKALDCIGDLSLAGARFIGRYRSFCAGHALNIAALEALMQDPRAFAMVVMDEAGKLTCV